MKNTRKYEENEERHRCPEDRDVSDKGRQNEDQTGSQKKLLKQEKRLRDRLLEAQQAQDNALERLRRAETRLRKRVERVQRLESRLNIVNQQMRALNAPLSTIVTLIPTVAESATRKAAHPTETTPEKPSMQVTGATQAPQTAMPAAKASVAPPISYRISTEVAEVPILTRKEESAGSKPASVEQASKADTLPEQPAGLESVADEMLAGEAEPQFLERFSASVDTPLDEEEVDEEEVPVTHTLSPAVLRAREARAVAEAAEEAAREAIERAEDVAEYLEQIGSARHLMQELEQLEDEAAQAAAYAREAEGAARAAERAAAESEGFLTDEEVKLTAEEKQIIAAIPPEEERELDAVEEQSEEEPPINAVQPDILADSVQEAQQVQAAPLNGEVQGVVEISSIRGTADRYDLQAGGVHTYAHPTQLEIVQVEEINEEEETLETVAAMIIADAAAIAAAEAEALAEASSARTREARRAALEADRVLGTIRLAIRNGALVGDEAAAALMAAERDATHAHAVLADAEATEERALTAAMNAEAEAEVAEGMALASGEGHERDEYGSAYPMPAEEPALAATETDDVDLELDGADADSEQDEDDEGGEDTQKLPRVDPEQS